MISRSKRAICLAVALASYGAIAQDDSQLQQGLQAFEAGNYAQALQLFQAVEQSGDSSESIQYNIAVSLFRLGQWSEAEERFLSLVSQPNWRVLVNYNLGLVNEAQGDMDDAREYFKLSATQQEHDKVRELANRKLAELDQEDQSVAGMEVVTRSADRFAGLIEISAGADSNASSLADELLEKSDRGEDNYTQLLLYGHAYAVGQRFDGVRIHALGFSKSLAEFDHLDSQVVGLGVTWEQPILGLQTELGTTVLRTDLNSEKIADQLQLRASVWKRFGVGTIDLGLTHTDYNASDKFSQIDGDQQRVDLTWTKSFSDVRASIRLRRETNDRADLSRNGAFASYSPTRNSVRTKLDWQINDRFSSGVQYEYVDSEFDDLNRLRDVDGQVKTAKRENTKSRWSADINYRPSDNWRMGLEYEYGDVDDNFQIYTYEKHVVSASINYSF